MANVDSGGGRAENASLGELFSRMTGDFGSLIRKEIELAKVETKAEVAKAGKAGGKLGVAGVSGHLAVLFLSFALVYLLDYAIPLPLAFFLVALAYAIAAFVLMKSGREQMKKVNPAPEQTVQTLKEDVEWAKTRNS